MFENFLENMYKIVDGFKTNILPIFDFLNYEFTFENFMTAEVGDMVTLTVGGILFGGGLIILLTYKIILSLTPVA